MKNLFSTILILFAFSHLQAQVKTKNFTLKPVGVSVISEMNGMIDTFSTNVLAPEPYSSHDIDKKKEKLNWERKQYFRKINRRDNLDTTEPQEPYLPFLEGGFTDSLFTRSVPNDNHICVGNNGDIISVLNSQIRVYKNPGNSNLTYNVGLSFFGRVEPKNDFPNGVVGLTGSYDPKAMYDPISDRFIVIWLDGRVSFDTRIVVAVSQTNDAAGAYSIYHLEGNPLGDKSWTDYPILSQSEDDIFITVNLLRDSASWQTAFKQSVIWQMDKKSFYEEKKMETTLWFDIKHNNQSIWSICPVDQYYKSPSTDMYFLSVRPSDLSNDSIFFHKISGTQASGNAQYSYEVLKTEQPYGLAGSAFQPGQNFRLQTNDSRILTAIYYYGNIQYAQNSINFANTAPSIMHGFMQNKSGSWSVKNKLISSDTLDFGYPSMAYMGKGSNDHSAMLTFSHSSRTAFPGTSLVKIEPLKSQETKSLEISNLVRVRTGNAVINSFVPDSMERWGDYTGLQAKYNEDGVFYIANSVGLQNKMNAGTYIGRMKYAEQEGILEIKESTIFPNPNGTGYYYTYLENIEETNYKLRVVQLSDGKLVVDKMETVTSIGNVKLEIDLSFLPAGNYAVQLYKNENEEPVLNKKIQKY